MVEATTICEEGYTCRSRVGDFELSVDAAGEEGPTPNQVLIADYASCFVPALRVAGQQRDEDDLGRIRVDVEGDLDEDDDLEAIRFHIQLETDIDDDTLDDIVERAEDICHVHAALREELHADIDADAGVV